MKVDESDQIYERMRIQEENRFKEMKKDAARQDMANPKPKGARK